MKKIEADSLEEAYKDAAKALNCSVTEIEYEIVQYPTTGMMGLFKKQAIIIAIKKRTAGSNPEVVTQKEESISPTLSTTEEEKPTTKERNEIEPSTTQTESNEKSNILSKQELLSKEIAHKEDKVLDGFFETKREESPKKESPKEVKTAPTNNQTVEPTTTEDEEEEYFEHAFDDDRDSPQNRKLSLEIENKLKVLFASSCFEIDTVEVDVFNNTAHMFVDGEDAALLIGKEGYRYNALSYMLFNWINSQYNLYIKLEIAEFIQTQEEMIFNYLKPIIEHVKEKGRGKTKPLDGILVQIALEQLRIEFPNKYVAIKTGKDGNKFIIINNFNNKKNG